MKKILINGLNLNAIKDLGNSPKRLYRKSTDKRTKLGKHIARLKKYLHIDNFRIFVLYVFMTVALVAIAKDTWERTQFTYLVPHVRANTLSDSIEVVESWQVDLSKNYLVKQYEGKGQIKDAIINYCSELGYEATKFYLFAAWAESNVMSSPVNWSDDHTSWCKGEQGKGSHGLFHFSRCTYKGLGGTDINDPIEQIKVVCNPKVYASRKHYWYYTSIKFANQ